MKKTNGNGPHPRRPENDNDMRPEYDFSQGIRGKYADRFKAKGGCYLVSIDLDLRRYFPDDRAVNSALRELAQKSDQEARVRIRRKSA